MKVMRRNGFAEASLADVLEVAGVSTRRRRVCGAAGKATGALGASGSGVGGAGRPEGGSSCVVGSPEAPPVPGKRGRRGGGPRGGPGAVWGGGGSGRPPRVCCFSGS